MRTVRRVAVLALVGALGLAACGDSHPDGSPGSDGSGRSVEAAREALEAAEEQVDGVVADLVPRLERALRTSPSGGRAYFATCGMEPSPSGAEYWSKPQLGASPLPVADATAAVVAVLEAGGWRVERPENDRVVLGTRDPMTVRVDVGAAATVVHVESGCVDTTPELARELGGRPAEDVALPG